MAQYIGFSTINANKPKTTNSPVGIDGGVGSLVNPINPGKKYKLVDTQLVLQDFINSLNIRQGEKVGNPSYGTILWNFVFEPNTPDVQFALENEIRRVASTDPRIILDYVKAYPQENGILMEVQMAIAPFNQALILSVFFDSNTNTATQASTLLS
jgi:phage baseplate assembly protein W